MKTLKKTLCLVLAVVMVVGALVLPASAAYKDNTSIGDTYKTAVTNLTTWKIMEGDANGNFKPKASIQRQEMAAIVYRLLTGDNGGYGKDKSAIYTPYAAKFTDVDTKGWAAGYIGYCANKGIIVGTNPARTTFEPTREIPAQDVLAMLLRAVGYGQNNEYTGPGWTTNVGSDAARVGLTKGITSKLDAVSERQEVAQMTYQAATTNRVTWSEAEQKYIPYVTPNNPDSGKNISLVQTKPVAATPPSSDAWGAPTGGTAATIDVIFTYPSPAVTYTVPVATPYPMLWQTWDAVTECDVADALDIGGNHWAITYTNGSGNKNLGNGNTDLGNPMPFEATDTVSKIGHEGRHFMVYKNPAFTGSTPSEKNPDYIFVFVDEFYAKVTSTWDAVLDPAGHEIRAAGANVTVYSNEYANASDTDASDGATAITQTATLTGTGYTVGQVLGVHLLTNTPTNGLAKAPTVANGTATQKTVGYGPFALSTATVTVKDIAMDAANGATKGKGVGIVATNGARYFYNYTCSDKPLTGSDINKSVILTLDSQGNILKWVYAPSTAGFGVTLSASVKQIAIGEYVLTYTVLLPDGSQTTVDVGATTTGAAFGTQTDAENYYKQTVGANKLVYFAPGTTGPYNAFSTGNVTASIKDDTIVSGRPQALSESYTTDPVRGETSSNAAADGSLLNDNTVFFVANYAPDNTTTSNTNDYVFTGYSIYVGEKNIPDMTFATNSQTKTPAATGTGAAQTVSALTVEAFEVGANGAPVGSANAGGYAKYVLVVNATKQSTPKTIPVMKYAYLVTNDLIVDMGATTFKYPAIINGQAGQNLQVKLASDNPLKNSGLYTYANWTNGEGYSDVYMMDASTAPVNTSLDAPYNGDFEIEKDLYAYADGVLTSYAATGSKTTPAAGDVYYAVAAGCQVYLVNPTTGKVTTNGLGLLGVKEYASACDIWFQLDANGYVSLIYMIDNENTAVDNPTQPAADKLTLTLNSATVTGTDGSATITVNALKVDGTGTLASGSPTVTVNYVIEKWTDNGWTAYCTATNDVTLASGTYTFSSVSVTANTPLYVGTYRVTVTAKSGDATAKLTEYLGLSITGTP